MVAFIKYCHLVVRCKRYETAQKQWNTKCSLGYAESCSFCDFITSFSSRFSSSSLSSFCDARRSATDERRTWRQFEINNAAGQDNVSSVAVPSCEIRLVRVACGICVKLCAVTAQQARNWRYIIFSRIYDSIRKLEGREIVKNTVLDELGGISKIDFFIS